ncbi:elongation factor TS-domain-containing protein [Hygrophoropsis aurantiaca]|uniref:Elongation factor TS-domain-containing protein n=1 Tax=Hygrophoropsis aurantiaca TaxID=72124 RepID=A0ACB8ACU9_9AGAM|nr:elongation factor TS-domain-containing protein [Hygrophoropsis aurantiaca]
MLSRCISRAYSTSLPKPPLQLVAQLRKLTDVSITKAREALIASNNDVNAALQWLEKDLAVSGARQAAKVEGRDAREGLIGISILSSGSASNSIIGSGGIRAAMIELNCETDFVGRNTLFTQLAADIAHTAAFISDPVDSGCLINPCPLDLLNDAPLISHITPHSHQSSTVSNSIRDLIAKVGEKVSLKRVVTVVQPPAPRQATLGLRLGSYMHGSMGSALQGRIGGLAVIGIQSQELSSQLSSEPFMRDMEKLERSVARQIVGFETKSIKIDSSRQDGTALYEQPFMMLGGEAANETVRDGLDKWGREHGLRGNENDGIEVLEFAKWTVGEVVE